MDYVLLEVVVPAIQNTMLDAFQGGVERWVRGETRPRMGSRPMGYADIARVDYTRHSKPGSTASTPPQRSLSRAARARHNFEDLVIPDRHGAEEVIDRMFEILSRHGSVNVADLYELTGLESNHTDMKWGWTQLRGAKAVRLRTGGFLLDLPEPQPLG
jgi:hypothetical protein